MKSFSKTISELQHPAPKSKMGRWDDSINNLISSQAIKGLFKILSPEYPINVSGLISSRWISIGRSSSTGPFLPDKAIYKALSSSYLISSALSINLAYLVTDLTILTISVS